MFLAVDSPHNPGVDAKQQSRGRNVNGAVSATPEIRSCRYCKAKFEVDPRFPHKEFCKETHRKLYWRYGSQSITKCAERIERDMRKLIEAEVKLLRLRMDALAERIARMDAQRGGGAA